jgi:hypothetical protein
MNEEKNTCRYYFVDEAGDPNLFGSRGKIIIGTQGCSHYFILGMLDIPDEQGITVAFNELRIRLLADPYFKKVPSMQPVARKTALAFHAKDDSPEVRREVFSILRIHNMRFLAVVRNKLKVLEYVRQRNEHDQAYRYKDHDLYDYMVRVLFKNLLHKDDQYEICFSKRWKQDRTEALKQALETARQRFSRLAGIVTTPAVNVFPKTPHESGGLQAVDYFLWSLQRFYERNEDRYLELLWPSIKMVHDLDDTRQTSYGVYYTQKRPLTLAALDNNLPGI